MKALLLLIFSFCFFHPIASQIFHNNVSLTPSTVTTFPNVVVGLLGNFANFSLTPITPVNISLVSVCIQTVQTAQSFWGVNSCEFFGKVNVTNQTVVLNADLMPGNYFFGFSSQSAVNLSVTLDGLLCNENWGFNCSSDKALTVNQPSKFSFNPSETTLYIALNVQTPNATLSPSYLNVNAAIIGNNTGSAVEISIYEGNVPYLPSNQRPGKLVTNVTQNLIVDTPAVSKYFIVLSSASKWFRRRRSLSSFVVEVSYQVTICGYGLVGNPCQNTTFVNTNTTSVTNEYTTPPGKFSYFMAPSTQSFNVSVQYVEGNGAPNLYLRKNQAPSQYEYDILSLNSSVNSILIENQNSTNTYFIGVLGTNNTYALWFNSWCPNGCSGNGDCQQAPNTNSYECSCYDGFDLFDCSLKDDTGFKTEYIVLIVIGSIIALAALLGLIVYLYNRGRHPGGGYERI